MIRAGLAVTLLLPCAALAAQRPPRFASQAEIVTVDVVALDDDGKPVAGLKRDDFVVREDGRLQAISAFEEVQALLPALVSPPTVASTPAPTQVATNVAGPPTRRTFAIVFDDLHVGDLDLEQAKRAVEAFVRRDIRPGDRLVLFTTSDGRYWATTRGSEDDAFAQALRRVRAHERKADPFRPLGTFGMMHYEAMRIEEAGDEQVLTEVQNRLGLCLPPGAAGPLGRPGPAGGQEEPPVRHCQDAAEVYTLERGRVTSTLRVVREVIRSLAPTPGRKSLVLVTTGFPIDPALDLFREVREQAARANVVLNYLDARGLPVAPPPKPRVLPSGKVQADVAFLWRMNEEGPKAIAEETGGVVLQTNDLAGALEKVADESRVTYLLGYQPTNEKRDGRYRRLSVEVRRPGLRVRARAGYFAAHGKEKPAPLRSPLERAMRGLFDADGVPLRLAAYVMGTAAVDSPERKTGAEVLIAGEVRLDALAWQAKHGRRVAEPTLWLLTNSREGESHDSSWTLEIALSDAVPELAGGEAVPPGLWHPFVTRIAMAPGDHRARLVMQTGEKVGSVTVDFLVPPVSEERLSTPILSDRLVKNVSERRVMPLARRDFSATSTLNGWVELLGAATDEATGQPRATAGFAARSAGGRVWASGPAVAMSLEAGRPTRLVSLPLAGAPPGENELVLTVHDGVSHRDLEARASFRVEPAR